MNRRVELLGVFFWVLGGLQIVGALVFVVVGVLGGLGVISPHDTQEERIQGLLGAALLGCGLGASGAGHVVVGTSLRRLRSWSRTAGMVIGVVDILCCCNAPFGTAVGIYALIVLLNEEVARLFQGR